MALAPAFSQTAQNGRQEFLIGARGGLYRASMREGGIAFRKLWDQGEVRSMIPTSYGWFFLTSKGIVFSKDLQGFEDRSRGLPVKVLKVFDGAGFIPVQEMRDIKAMAIDPVQENRIVACTNSELFYSETSGKTWISLGSPAVSPGIKAVSFGPWNGTDQLVVWVSHSIKGVFIRDINGKNGWINASLGLPKVFGSNVDEVSSFALIPAQGSTWTFLAGTSFLGRVFCWDQGRKAFAEVFSDGRDFGTVESLTAAGRNQACALAEGQILRLTLDTGNARLTMAPETALTATGKALISALRSQLSDSAFCVSFSGPQLPDAHVPPLPATMNELWLLARSEKKDTSAASPNEGTMETRAMQVREKEALRRRQEALGKAGIYLQTGFVVDPASRTKYFGLIESLGLNSLVIDMKDDYGRLRFAPRSPILAALGKTGDILDLETFVDEARRQGIYLVARIVVFKDETLYRWGSGALAVRDAKTGVPWQGSKADGQTIREYWVDPYSPLVWQYNVAIAKEVLARGFDEVQFDYIRFPTDGENIDAARFIHQDAGMTQDSAIESFLRYARQEITAPISVDIYGANGWYRSGARTGQDVEMLSNYVDVICPMLYPSHFEQEFLADSPAELRPYRIYKLGTLRNQAIARDKVLIRPYVQAFYLDVSYDRAYYSERYVEDEVRGVREGSNQGMTFWNNSGRYADVPAAPDVPAAR